MSPETLSAIESTWFGVIGREVYWIFPALETLHFFGLCILFGALLVVDLRILGVTRNGLISATFNYIPIAIFGFVINMVTGLWFFCVDPFRYYPNIAFRIKMILIVLAGINALIFWVLEHKRLKASADGATTNLQSRTIAFISLAIWVLVIICGRMMPYVEFV